MTGASSPPDHWPPIAFYRHSLVAIVAFIVSAASFVAAVFLLTFCVPIVTSFGTTGCAFQHQLAGYFFVGGGVLFLLLGLVYGSLAWLSLEPERYQELVKSWHSSWNPGGTNSPVPPIGPKGSGPPRSP